VTRRQKLISRICARPPEADFGDVRNLLEDFGWTLNRESGSHATFTKQGEYPIVVPKVRGRRVKRTYLEQIIDRLGLEC
jgi:predicted RNA binding protein YcfA (HicA-like mRNA interferase family)